MTFRFKILVLGPGVHGLVRLVPAFAYQICLQQSHNPVQVLFPGPVHHLMPSQLLSTDLMETHLFVLLINSQKWNFIPVTCPILILKYV